MLQYSELSKLWQTRIKGFIYFNKNLPRMFKAFGVFTIFLKIHKILSKKDGQISKL